MPRVNLADADTNFPVLPAGNYPCRLVSAEYKSQSKSSGQPYYLLTFTVDDELSSEGGGQNLFRNLSLQKQALWALKGALKAMGADEDVLSSDDVDLDEIFAGLIGTLVTLKVGTRSYTPPGASEPQERNEVQQIMAYSEDKVF